MTMAVQTRAKATPTIKPVVLSTQRGLLQRKCACGGTPGVDGECAECRAKRLQRKAITSLTSPESTLTTHHGLLQRCSADGECAECRAKRLSMQRRAAAPVASSQAVPPIVHDVLASPGHSLDAGTRAFMEPRFGHDFSQVRVHTDAKAAESARAVNALAYTVGRDVVFVTGQYAPGTSEGKKLMAHELTHVVQQSGMSDSGRMQRQLEVGQVNDPAEREADAQAASVVDSPGTGKASPQSRGGTTLEKPQHDISKAPKDMLCTAVTGSGLPSGTDIFFDLASSDIPSKEDVKRTISNRKAIEDFKASWVRGGSRDDVLVHGYASADGKQVYNWRLSCNRAEAVKDELSSVIPENKITTFAHGETDEFSKTSYEPNRHAIITRVPSPKPPPGPGPAPTPTPPEPRKVPTKFKVETPHKGEVEKDGKVKNLEVKVQPAEHATVTPKTLSNPNEADDPAFQFTSNAGVQIPTIVHLAGVPQKHDPCDFIVSQVGGKWNWKGRRIGSRLTLGGSTELDLGFNPAFCNKSPWFTPQLQQDILKLVIMKDVWEATFQGIFGLQDDWLKNLGGTLQGGILLEWHPWGEQKSSWYSNLKFGATGLLIWNFDSKGSTLDLGGQFTIGIELP